MDHSLEIVASSSSDLIHPFEYASEPEARTPEWSGLDSLGLNPSDVPSEFREKGNIAQERSADLAPESEAVLRERERLSFEAGRRCGRQEGRAEAERESSVAAGAEQKRFMQGAAASLAALAHQRDSYLRAVESEVVALALGVASRILRHEAQIDPLLLTGAVRVALGQIAESTRAQLFVPAPELGMWKETLAHLPNLLVQPEISAGEGMRAGDCLLRTEVGTADLGLRAQLKEIERGFYEKPPCAETKTKSSVPPVKGPV